MSHFKAYECKVSNVEHIKKALVEMGLTYKENVAIVDWAKQKVKAELGVVKDGKLLPLGFVRNQQTSELELQADWFMTPYSEKQFTERISQLHSKHEVLEVAAENRWNIDENDIIELSNGDIEIRATQFV